MTTPAAEAHYLARHRHEMEGRRWATFNPKELPLEELPVIFGFNNGGGPGWWRAELIAQDGTYLGGHVCSAEGYMEHDLGILEGTRPDRHEGFRAHYPDGYRMEFVGYEAVPDHAGLNEALRLNKAKQETAEAAPPASAEG